MQEEEWIWEDAVYPAAWLAMLSGVRLAWDSWSRVILCGCGTGSMLHPIVRGKLSAQYSVYYPNAALLRKSFSGPGSEQTQVAGTDSSHADMLGTVRKTRFLFCNAASGALSDSYPRTATQHVHMPPNLTAYRQEGGAQLIGGRHVYFLYGSSLGQRALINLVATERELNSGAISGEAWVSFVRVKLAGVKRTYGLLEARRWHAAYELYFEGDVNIGLRFLDLVRM